MTHPAPFFDTLRKQLARVDAAHDKRLQRALAGQGKAHARRTLPSAQVAWLKAAPLRDAFRVSKERRRAAFHISARQRGTLRVPGRPVVTRDPDAILAAANRDMAAERARREASWAALMAQFRTHEEVSEAAIISHDNAEYQV